ncbi:MAG: hypothetical protein GY757_09045, partial [bacterium]|nr:hypothetical protein [bacterium]
MKLKSKRKRLLFKVTLSLVLGIASVYLFFLIFAPHQLQRLGSLLRSKITAVKTMKISIATAGRSGHYYRLGRLLKRRLELDESCEVEAQVTNGTLENLERLRDKQADFAFIQGS